MNCDATSNLKKEIQQTTIKTGLVCLFLSLSFFSCSKHVKKGSIDQAISTFSDQSKAVHTLRGRVWVSVKSKQRSFSFPGLVFLDRRDSGQPRFRMDAIDPLGSSHGMVLVSPDNQLCSKSTRSSAPFCMSWVDLDHNTAQLHRRFWNGFPIEELPDLLLGLVHLSEKDLKNPSVLLSKTEAEFEVRQNSFTLSYGVDWVAPGPKPVIREIKGKLRTGEVFLVEYSKYQDVDQYFLPQVIRLKAFVSESEIQNPYFESEMKWRERSLNMDSSSDLKKEVFTIPSPILEKLKEAKR